MKPTPEIDSPKNKAAGTVDASPQGEGSGGRATFNEWALVELFGHQRIVGKVSEATLAGGAFLRVDVPAFNGSAAFTRFYGPSAIYSMSPVTEDIARGLMERYRNEPVSRFDLPQLADKVDDGDDDGEFDDEHSDLADRDLDSSCGP